MVGRNVDDTFKILISCVNVQSIFMPPLKKVVYIVLDMLVSRYVSLPQHVQPINEESLRT